MTGSITIEPLAPHHDRKGFSCGIPALDRYFSELAAQDVKRRVSNCFVAVAEGGAVAGYYTLAAASLSADRNAAGRSEAFAALPAPAGVSHWPPGGRCEISPAPHRGLPDPGCGGARDARRSGDLRDRRRREGQERRRVLEHLGFRRFESRPMSLFMPMSTAVEALQEHG